MDNFWGYISKGRIVDEENCGEVYNNDRIVIHHGTIRRRQIGSVIGELLDVIRREYKSELSAICEKALQ